MLEAGESASGCSRFEAEARSRGGTHAFVTSFTFQAPAFYEKQGYREIFRWEGVPTPDARRPTPDARRPTRTCTSANSCSDRRPAPNQQG